MAFGKGTKAVLTDSHFLVPFCALLAGIARRAEGYYASAHQLLPLIDAESRPAMWVLVSIYHRLLKRIQDADYDVFSRRISVPLSQKLGILTTGQARIALARMFG